MVGIPTALRPPPDVRLRRRLVAGAALAAALAYLAMRLGYANQLAYLLSLAVMAVSIGYLLWRANPAWTLSLGILLAPFAGHWALLGLPGGYVAPDRILVVGAVGVIALRGPWMRTRPTLVRHPTHVIQGLAVA